MRGVNRILIAYAVVMSALYLTVGCTSTSSQGAASDGTAAVATASGERRAGGAELWANNCRRCHNVRSPSIYSDAEWDVAVHHMRVRAYLTGEEERTIAEFLKAAN